MAHFLPSSITLSLLFDVGGKPQGAVVLLLGISVINLEYKIPDTLQEISPEMPIPSVSVTCGRGCV